jgi:hypothetical protein
MMDEEREIRSKLAYALHRAKSLNKDVLEWLEEVDPARMESKKILEILDQALTFNIKTEHQILDAMTLARALVKWET